MTNEELQAALHAAREQAVKECSQEVADALNRLDLLAGLSEEQAMRVASVCSVSRFADGERLFTECSPATRVFVLIEGEVEVSQGGRERSLGRVAAGESLGEVALLMGQPHSATATARSDVTTADLSRAGFEALVRQRPDIGTALFRNLAVGLGHKLLRLDREVSAN